MNIDIFYPLSIFCTIAIPLALIHFGMWLARRIANKALEKEDLEATIYCRDMYDAVLDADALLLLTEWKEFRLPGWGVIRKAMKRPRVIDGRNIFDTEELDENSFEYHCIGK